MEQVFLSVLNMSLTASFVIAVILFARLPLKKAPKFISYCLWAVAGFRLVFPITLESVFSLLPFKSAPIPQDIAMQAVPRIDSGITIIDNAISAVLPAATPTMSANPLQGWMFAGSCVWLVGIAVMLIYSIASIMSLKHRLRSAVFIEGNLYEAENLKTPFVIGLFRPMIYIPVGLTGEERRYIVLHEQTHIRRHDHIVKMVAYFVLCLHWFNPFVWVAFILMGADMEMSCDESVMQRLGSDIKNDYSLSLVRMAAGRKILNGSPLAFGEGGMKERIKNVLNFKKSSRVIIIVAVAVVAMLTVGFAVNRTQGGRKISAETAVEQLADSIEFSDGEVRFQIPADYPEANNWNLHISGRAEFEDGFSMSVHELEDVNERHAWEAGEWYSISTEGRSLTNLTMDIYLPDENGAMLERSVALLAATDDETVEALSLVNVGDDFVSGATAAAQEFWGIGLDEAEVFSKEFADETWINYFVGGDALYGVYVCNETGAITAMESVAASTDVVASAAMKNEYVSAASKVMRSAFRASASGEPAIYRAVVPKQTINSRSVYVVYSAELIFIELSVADLHPVGYRVFRDMDALNEYLRLNAAAL